MCTSIKHKLEKKKRIRGMLEGYDQYMDDGDEKGINI